jgi:hypothetical protein
LRITKNTEKFKILLTTDIFNYLTPTNIASTKSNNSIDFMNPRAVPTIRLSGVALFYLSSPIRQV